LRKPTDIPKLTRQDKVARPAQAEAYINVFCAMLNCITFVFYFVFAILNNNEKNRYPSNKRPTTDYQ